MKYKGFRNSVRIRSILVRLVVAVIATFGAIVALPSPAQAIPGAEWRPYTKTSDWHCTARNNMASGVAGEACVVVRGRLAQGVVILRNTSGNTIEISGTASLYLNGDLLTNWWCNDTFLSNGYARACYTDTASLLCSDYVSGQADLWTNLSGRHIWFSDEPPRPMCQ
ncbi:hypothetical protein ACFP2T_36390 [Plantactinospora solaniradicis]|uniref:Uncharacterized protein n=1 Tax=Plantactinospora solaniradicis TaxID=1723736 RepID=A0ABW1KIN7_9ACTN